MNNPKPKITPALPRGMRDLLPDQLAVRYKVIETLRRVFELYGFQPLETPAMERLEILSGKGGEESDKLSFLVMKRGDEFLKALEKVKSEGLTGTEASRELADMGLRYDLTVPLARVAAMYQGKLPTPFKRYQIAPVWRAERPQHGRYREFTQCDVDIVGTDSPVADVEIISLFLTCFQAFGLEVELVINDRRVLAALSEACGNRADQFTSFCISLDKLDKIGWDGVSDDMSRAGLNVANLDRLKSAADYRINLAEGIYTVSGNPLVELIGQSAISAELPAFQQMLRDFGVTTQGKVIFDPTLARGLDYYTGTILEVKLPGSGVGSLGGGGRYDGLVGAFSKNELPAVGASFGLDRIADVISGKASAAIAVSSSVEILNGDEIEWDMVTGVLAGNLAMNLRDQAIPTTVTYLAKSKLGKQIQSASRNSAGFVVIVKTEGASDSFDVKRLVDGEQKRLTLPEIVEWIKESTR